MNISRFFSCAAATLALTGCPSNNESGSSANTPGASASAAASGTTNVNLLTASQLDELAIPTEQDFESQAHKDIAKKNYVDELGKLQKEIDADTE